MLFACTFHVKQSVTLLALQPLDVTNTVTIHLMRFKLGFLTEYLAADMAPVESDVTDSV